MSAMIAAGLVLGLSAGLAPGPLLALVLRQSLRHGRREGLMVALAPLLSDLPIVTLALALAHRAMTLDPVFVLVSFGGAVYVIVLAVETARAELPSARLAGQAPRSLLTGALANVLSPHPYLFWLTVGAPTVVTAHRQHGWAASAGFIVAFYLLLVGSKVVLALLVGGSRQRISPRLYRAVMRTLAAALVAFAVLLAVDGWQRLSTL